MRFPLLEKQDMDGLGAAPKKYKNTSSALQVRRRTRIIIVVDKLLTGFDAPRNTFPCRRSLREHTLLQEYARISQIFST